MENRNYLEERFDAVKDAVNWLGICERSLRKRITTGEIKSVRFGRRVLIRRSDLIEFLEQASQPQTDE